MYFQTQGTQWERSLETESKQSSLERNHAQENFDENLHIHENLAVYDVASYG